jgi:hypothetical protein
MELPARSLPAQPEALSGAAEEVLAPHCELLAVRRRHPWLVGACTVVEHLENTRLLLRVTDGTSELLVALDLGEPHTFVLPSSPWRLVSRQGELAGNCVGVAVHGLCVLAADD